MGARAKHWVFTLNNYDDEDDHMDTNLWEYLVVGKEIGDNGTPHLQGYGCLKDRKRLAGMKKISARAHWEVKRGTPLEASNYCKKGEQTHAEWKELKEKGPNFGKNADFIEHGTIPDTAGQATTKRNIRDWDKAFESAKKGKFEEIPNDMLIRYYSAFKRIRQDHPDKMKHLRKTCGVWLHGVSGAGKSYTARKRYTDMYDKPLNKWWDGYQYEGTVLLDDVGHEHKQWIGFYLKRWADRYSFPAEEKGSSRTIRPQHIVVTSQYTIADLFAEDANALEAIERRFIQEEIVRNESDTDETESYEMEYSAEEDKEKAYEDAAANGLVDMSLDAKSLEITNSDRELLFPQIPVNKQSRLARVVL